MTIVLAILSILCCIGLIGLVIMQEGNSRGLGTIGGGAETFFGRNKGRAMDATLKRLTSILAVLFVILTIILYAKTSI